MLIRESREFTTIANIAIRFKLEEMDPEGKARDMIKGGLLSGLPVDERFFYVFCECIVFWFYHCFHSLEINPASP